MHTTKIVQHQRLEKWIQSRHHLFKECVRVVSRWHIPRGCRTNYIPGLTEESKSLYEAYQKQYSRKPVDEETLETGNRLTDKIRKERKEKWDELITSTDLTHNSRNVWQTIRKTFNDLTTTNPPCLVTANQVAHQLLINIKATMSNKPKRQVLPQYREGMRSVVCPFSE